MKLTAKSDVGKIRENNEDSYYMKIIDENASLFIVADGLGGYLSGEVASSMLTKEVSEYLCKKSRWLKNASDEKIKYAISNAIKYANEKIYNLSESDLSYKGMGTTITLVFIINNRIFYTSIGDSRLYYIDSNLNNMEQITIDDTYVNELLKTNVINEDEAKSHPQKHVLTKAIGILPKIDLEVKTVDLGEGYLLLCTDGMSNMLTESEVINIFKSTKFDDVASNIIVRANENGGSDNITVIVVKL